MAARSDKLAKKPVKAVPESVCPKFHWAVELIGKRWTGAILRVLLDGPTRFGEIQARVPDLSDRLLSERLKELEARRLVARSVEAGPPVRVQYTLTTKGRGFEQVAAAIERWGRELVADD